MSGGGTEPGRIRLAVWALLAVGWFWAVLVAFGLWHDARWPQAADARQNFAVFGLIVSFLLVKVILMAARTRTWTRLGASLIASNVAFALLYCYVMAAALWPVLATWTGFGWQAVDALRAFIVVAVAWAAIELILTPDPPADDGSADVWDVLEDVTGENARLAQENERLNQENARLAGEIARLCERAG